METKKDRKGNAIKENSLSYTDRELALLESLARIAEKAIDYMTESKKGE